jgi:hypothetical protein
MKLMNYGDMFNPKNMYVSYLSLKHTKTRLNIFTVDNMEIMADHAFIDITSIRVVGIDHTLNELYPYNMWGGTMMHIADAEIFELSVDEMNSIIAENI